MHTRDSVIESSGLTLSAGGDIIVRDVDLRIARGQVMGLVGESGAGKTTVALALLGYARPGTAIEAGDVHFYGINITHATDSELRDVLGRRIAFVPQNPGAALNPSLTIAAHVADVLEAHGEAVDAARIKTLLESVALPGDHGFQARYPHQLSGGQQQRVVIAIALACSPELVVLDEPTTGLDVTTQAQIVDLLSKLRAKMGTALLYVSHNLALVGQVADSVAVMYGGVVVESGTTAAIFDAPRHPYTRMLIDAVPRLDGPRCLPVGISGPAPGRGNRHDGCPFAARCSHRRSTCEAPQILEAIGADHAVRCGRWSEIELVSQSTGLQMTAVADADPYAPLLQIQDLRAAYRTRGGETVAVAGITLEMKRGECLAVVGESGSGKTTVARCVAGLHRDWSGSIEFDGEPLAHRAADRSRALRQRIQIVFQNPDKSLNPRHTVGDLIGRPCRQLLGLDRQATRMRVASLLEDVRLSPRYANAYPTELSGGERQRVAIARALAAEGDFIVCDEITSALDVSVQASLLELLVSLREEHRLSLLFISHDLAVVRAIADRIVVMQNGVVCEEQTVERLFATPQASYTQALLAAAPRFREGAVQ